MLETYLNDFTKHILTCSKAKEIENEKERIKIQGETRQGLASILNVKCIGCGETIDLTTSKKILGPKQTKRWECNLASVWGQMASGGGHSTLREEMAVLGVPIMTEKSFIHTERDIGTWWEQELNKSMKQAGEEERRLAIEHNEYHEGIPAITVILDGGWSKRSHKHSYNAKSGVAVIIGCRTQKLLYIGVRNKFCTGCVRGLKEHTCFKNWTDSSSGMESDIILQGFLQAETIHGVRYTTFIGDGDSSVHTTLIAGVPGWGRAIQKLECANHACKCYRNSLENIVRDNPKYKGKGGLTSKMRQRLTSAARCAIKMRSEEENRANAIQKLQADLKNGPFHCFGIHDQCSPDFCISKQKTEKTPTTTPTTTNPSLLSMDEDEDYDISDIAAEQVQCIIHNYV